MALGCHRLNAIFYWVEGVVTSSGRFLRHASIIRFRWCVEPLSPNSTTGSHYVWLGISAVTTILSWLPYFKALELVQVSTISIIDKGSLVVAVLFTWLLVGLLAFARSAGLVLIFAGLLVVSFK